VAGSENKTKELEKPSTEKAHVDDTPGRGVWGGLRQRHSQRGVEKEIILTQTLTSVMRRTCESSKQSTYTVKTLRSKACGASVVGRNIRQRGEIKGKKAADKIPNPKSSRGNLRKGERAERKGQKYVPMFSNPPVLEEPFD